jgi:hypothetical protein
VPTCAASPAVGAAVRPNKGMKLTKLSAAPEHGRPAWLSLRCRLMPAPAGLDAGTASQLIPGVLRTLGEIATMTEVAQRRLPNADGFAHPGCTR